MAGLLIVLLIGLAVGNMGFITDKTVDRLRRVSTMGLMLLLFSMGAQLGINPDIVANLDTLGLKALLISSFSILFSTAALYLLDRAVMSKKLMASEEAELSEKTGLSKEAGLSAEAGLSEEVGLLKGRRTTKEEEGKAE